MAYLLKYAFSAPKKNLTILFLFLFFTGALVFSSPFYVPAKLKIQGSGLVPGSKIHVRWDSGNGFNGYEKESFLLGSVKPDENNGFHIRINKIGQGRVILNGIWLDGKRYSFSKHDVQGNVTQNEELVELKESQSLVEFVAESEKSIRIEFLTFNFGGKARVLVNEWEKEYDLYTPNDFSMWGKENVREINFWHITPSGEFEVVTRLPRYEIRQLQVLSSWRRSFDLAQATVKTEDGQAESLQVSRLDGYLFQLGFDKGSTKRFFHPIRFLLQLLYAALLTWLSLVVFSWYRRIDGLKNYLQKEKRYSFFFFFAGAAIVYSFWLVPFWPAVMSVDSLKVWRAAQIPGMFLWDHPPLNVVHYNFLSMIWNDIAVVPVSQVLIMSLLAAWVYWNCYRRQVSLRVIVLLYLMMILSIPIGLYNTLLWKDNLFAVLVVIYGLFLVSLYEKQGQVRIRFLKQYWPVFFMLLIALPLIRYNGALYLGLTPFYLLMFGIFRIPGKRVLHLVAALFMVVLIFFSIPQLRNGVGGRLYFVSQSIDYLTKMKQSFTEEFAGNKVGDYFGVFNVNQKKTKWDHFHNFLQDRHEYTFLKRVGWNDVYSYLKRNKELEPYHKFAMQIYEKSYEKPWVFLTWNPVFLLFLFPMVLLAGKWLPRSALFSSVILAQVLALIVIVQVMNWRYYYFAYLGGLVLLPLLAVDINSLFQKKLRSEHAV